MYQEVGLQNSHLTFDKPLFKRVRGLDRIVYSTAIAPKLAAQSSFTAAQITDHMIDSVSRNTLRLQDSQTSSSLSEIALQDVVFQVTQSGLIQAEFGDRAIAGWLDWIIQGWGAEGQGAQRGGGAEGQRGRRAEEWGSRGAEVFGMQHAHARCCSLLQMAHREGVITLNQSAAVPVLWQFVNPASIPWLDAEGQARLTHPSERRLIGHLFTVLDKVGCLPSPLSWDGCFQLSKQVYQGFQAFHRDRPIWHNVLERSRDLAHAQFGLVMATQRVLYHLLHDLMSINTPSDL